MEGRRHTLGVGAIEVLDRGPCVVVKLVGDIGGALRSAGAIVHELQLGDRANALEESLPPSVCDRAAGR